MKSNFLLITLFLFFTSCAIPKSEKVSVVKDNNGISLQVNGEPFMINGMNWDYFPIGTNHTYSLWSQSDDLIKAALKSEMTLLKNMGVNTIRVYTGIQPKWITYIYKNYGIYTMLNHPFGRYGVSVNGKWISVTNYSDTATQNALLDEVTKLAQEYKNTEGLLMYLLGNENNYGLFWAGAETEDFPDDQKEIEAKGEKLGRPMYRLINRAAKAIKAIDNSHPVTICNGDVGFINIVAEECKDIDIYGTNMYRGKSFRDAFEKVKKELNMPILFTEFGTDAYNSLTNKEDQKMQAFFMVENWKEIYQNAAGLGKADNSIGGFTFQFSDGWWKYKQDKYLNIHDTIATWHTDAYYLDTKNGSKNMNEEWFGICAKGPTDDKGLYTLQPRAAYYALQKAHKINPYAKEATLNSINKHFSEISLEKAEIQAKTNKAN